MIDHRKGGKENEEETREREKDRDDRERRGNECCFKVPCDGSEA